MVQHQSYHPDHCQHSHSGRKYLNKNNSQNYSFKLLRSLFCNFQYKLIFKLKFPNAAQNGQLCRQAWCPCNAIYIYLGSWLSTGQDFMRSIYLHDNASVVHSFVGVIDIATADYGVWSHPEGRLWQILLEIADHLKVHNCFPDSHKWDGNKKTILRPFSVLLLRRWWFSWTRCRDLSDPATTV